MLLIFNVNTPGHPFILNLKELLILINLMVVLVKELK